MSDYMKEMERLLDAHERTLILHERGAEWAEEPMSTRAALLAHAAQADRTVSGVPDSSVDELKWLEHWLQFAAEFVDQECCGKSVRGECCGSPNPIERSPADVINAMARRHSELSAMLAAAPAQADRDAPAKPTGHNEADRIVARLMSSDPNFQDCADAARLIQQEIKGPDGFATWRDAAIAERIKRVSLAVPGAPAAQPPHNAPVELPEPDGELEPNGQGFEFLANELFDGGGPIFSPSTLRTYGDAREAAGYARGVAEERERCAAICDRMGNPLNVKYEGGGCRKAAAAIRAAQKGDE